MYLTEHQRKILKLLRDGRTYAKTADALGMKISAVSRVVSRVVKRNRYNSTKELWQVVQHVDLDNLPKRKSRVRGVDQTKAGTWRARYHPRRGAYINLGTFRTEKEAINARLEAEKKCRGIPSQ